ncbi:MAG: Arc family DNA-binding protein [Gemmatimonadaceae bacterium]|nr:Arc family DNA-binding protein [Gemmatimonadaceae bacterium]
MAEKKPFLMRVDRELLDAIQRWANDDLRSVNGQVEFLLRDALKRAGRAPKTGDASQESLLTDPEVP